MRRFAVLCCVVVCCFDCFYNVILRALVVVVFRCVVFLMFSDGCVGDLFVLRCF